MKRAGTGFVVMRVNGIKRIDNVSDEDGGLANVVGCDKNIFINYRCATGVGGSKKILANF